MNKLTIGNVELANNVILAPMAGVSDLPFRLLCKEQGAGLVCMEMISAKAIYYNNKNKSGTLKKCSAFYFVFLSFRLIQPKLQQDFCRRMRHLLLMHMANICHRVQEGRLQFDECMVCPMYLHIQLALCVVHS